MATRSTAPTASKLATLVAASTAAAAVVSYYQYDNKSVASCGGLPVHGIAGTNQERTFLAVKPDGVQRGLIGDIIARFEKVKQGYIYIVNFDTILYLNEVDSDIIYSIPL